MEAVSAHYCCELMQLRTLHVLTWLHSLLCRWYADILISYLRDVATHALARHVLLQVGLGLGCSSGAQYAHALHCALCVAQNRSED